MEGLASVFARNCIISRIDRVAARKFLDGNHRLGSASGRYFYGLFVKRRTGSREVALPRGTLVAVASFAGPRRWDKDGRCVRSYEWVRYASLSGIRVTGGMGKMLQAFVDEVHPDDVMSYADLSSVDGGSVYKVLGFEDEGLVEKGGFCSGKYRLKLYGSPILQRESRSASSYGSTPAASSPSTDGF